jgi:hypothetical protein
MTINGKRRFFGRTAGALVFVLAGFLGSCDNPYVQEILRGAAVLDNMVVYTEDQVRYKLTPDFDSNILEYTTSVPYSTTAIMLEGLDHRDADIKYRISGDGVTYGEETGAGEFEFTKELYPWDAYVKVRVNRKHMDERTYTIHVIRISDAMLWDLRVLSKTGVPNDPGMFNALSPGYIPETTGYLVKVNAQAVKVSLWLLRKEGVTTKYRYRIDGGPFSGEEIIAPNQDAPGDEYTAEISFPADKESLEFEITVSMEVPRPSPHTETGTYTVKVVRPFQVEIDDTAGFTGGVIGGPRFSVGDVVSFTLSPPFGTETSGVRYTYTPSGGSEVAAHIAPSSSNLYSLIMPDAAVVISGECQPVPAAADTNVRYVWEGGAPYPSSGDGLSWVTATNDLQAVIDAFDPDDPAPGGNNYEIWVAKGTYTPDWSTINSASWYSGVPSDAPAHRWSFVLKDGVRIYGGFNGTEKDQAGKDSRDWQTNLTTLSGELGDLGTNRHAVVAAGTDSTPIYAYLEGLAVHGGYNVLGYSDLYSINGNDMNAFGYSIGNILYLVNARVFCKDVDFDNGQAHYASGIAVWSNAHLALINCTVKRSQSAGYGSALSLLNSTSRLVMIGGRLHLNWDAGGVFAVSGGKALLVNVRIDGNHENPVKVSNSGTGIFINTSITGNRGTTESDADRTITTDGAGTVHLYNSVVTDNFLQTYGDNVWFHNTIAPDINGATVNQTNGTVSWPYGSPWVNQGDDSYYPLDSVGAWSIGAPGYTVITDVVGDPASTTPGAWKHTAAAGMKAALLKDGNSNSRFNGTIDLGAVEQ